MTKEFTEQERKSYQAGHNAGVAHHRQAVGEPVLQNIEQYRMQMAGICVASTGYWKEGEGIHPDYDTIALRDVAKLYAKYAALYKTQLDQALERNFCSRCGKRLLGPLGPVSIHTCTPPNARTFDDYGNKIV
jgi:hypothetical protein